MSTIEKLLADFLSLKETAIELKVSKRTLDRWAVRGKGPPRTRIGRKILYRRESIQQWLAPAA